MSGWQGFSCIVVLVCFCCCCCLLFVWLDFFFWLFVDFLRNVSLYSPGSPGTHYKPGWLTDIPCSQGLELITMCATTLSCRPFSWLMIDVERYSPLWVPAWTSCPGLCRKNQQGVCAMKNKHLELTTIPLWFLPVFLLEFLVWLPQRWTAKLLLAKGVCHTPVENKLGQCVFICPFFLTLLKMLNYTYKF